jgi:hypothetical protein
MTAAGISHDGTASKSDSVGHVTLSALEHAKLTMLEK